MSHPPVNLSTSLKYSVSIVCGPTILSPSDTVHCLPLTVKVTEDAAGGTPGWPLHVRLLLPVMPPTMVGEMSSVAVTGGPCACGERKRTKKATKCVVGRVLK